MKRLDLNLSFFVRERRGGGVCMCLCMQPWMLYIKRLFNRLIKRLYIYIYIYSVKILTLAKQCSIHKSTAMYILWEEKDK